MSKETKARELTAAEADVVFDPSTLDFDTTDELDPLEEIVGQPRALKAMDLGLGIRHRNYNIYVAGLGGTGKKDTIRMILDDKVRDESVPSDWVYVHNFEQRDRPLAVDLPSGKGLQFKKDMRQLIQQLEDELPKAFREDDVNKERQRIGRSYEERNRKVLQEAEKLAEEKGLQVQQTPEGQLGMAPLKDGEPMSKETYNKLSDEEKEDISRRQQELAEHLEKLMSQGRELRRQFGSDVRNLEMNYARQIVSPHVDEMKQRYPHEKLAPWFDQVCDHLVENLDQFREDKQPEPGKQQMAQMLGAPAPTKEEQFKEYRVNVIVDNSKLEHAPVVIEDSPNYKNLFGTTGGVVDRFGRISGNFMNIRAGSLLRANGGYLVINLIDALVEPLVWKELKRSIKSGKMEFHAYDPLGVFTASAIRPEAVPLDVKLVVQGSSLVYHLFQLYDEDFSEIFQVKADFDSEMSREDNTGHVLARFVQKITNHGDGLPFSAGGVAELARTAVRLAGNKEKITAEFSRLGDLVRETNFWARQDQSQTVQAEHVRRAMEEKIYRSDLIAEKVRDLIREGTLRVNLDGQAVGRTNGLGLIDLGDYAFGKPTQITASVGIGAMGVINIERESKMSGHTYDKALMILEGYLRNMYARNHSLTLSAGITMEQNYGRIEGDSASIAELICLLSAISQLPARSDIGLTGSVNQWGDIQAVGGVNEKIEGFFHVCKEYGLTGNQGVCIPAANVRHLILHPNVLNAMREGTFHVWTIETVNQAIELMIGIPAGETDEKDSFHWKIDRRLQSMADALKSQRAEGERFAIPATASEPDGQQDPRPPLPPEINKKR